MQLKLFSILIIFYFLQKSVGSFIYYLDFSLDYPNANEFKTLSFSFSLDTTIDKTDYLKIVLPFEMHTTLDTQNIPTKMTAQYQEISASTCTSSYSLISTEIYYVNSAYYIRFKNSDGSQYTGLNQSVIYKVVLKTTEAYPTQTAGQQQQAMQLFTVSSLVSNAIIYDSNTMFTSIYLAEEPSDYLNISSAISSSDRYTLAAVYPMYLNILPNQGIPVKYRLDVILDKSAVFRFTSVCKYYKQAPNSQYEEVSSYNCSVDTTENRAYFTILEELEADHKYRIQVNIKNPNYPTSFNSITVLTQYYYSGQIVQKATHTETGFLMTSHAYIYRKWITLMYGLSKNAVLHYGYYLNLVKNAASSTYLVYNNLQFQFWLDREIDIENEIQLRISLKTTDSTDVRTAGSFALEGSIFTNLPIHPKSKFSKINCYIQNNHQLGGTKRYLICRGIGKLIFADKYYVGLRMTFDQGASLDQTAGEKFGTMDLMVLDDNGAEIGTYLVEKTELMTDFTLDQNQDFFRSKIALEYYYNNVFTVTNNSTKINDPLHGQEIMGMALANSTTSFPQKLVISMNVKNTSIYPSNRCTVWYSCTSEFYNDSTNPATYDTNGILFTLPKDFEFETLYDPTKSLQFVNQVGNTYGASADVFKGYGNMDEGNEEIAEFVKLRIKATYMKGIYYNLMIRQANDYWDNDNYLSALMNMRLNSHSSFYGESQQVYDFIGMTYAKIDKEDPAPKGYIFLFNGYTLTVPRPDQLRYAIVNWYGGSSKVNDAMYLPVLLRLAGSLTEANVGSNVKKFMIFFDQLPILRINPNDAWDASVDCSSTYGSVSCFGYQGEKEGVVKYSANYLFHSRIEVEFSNDYPRHLTTPFQLLFPVKSFSDYYQINLMFGTVMQHQVLIDRPFYQTVNLYRMTGNNNYNLTERLFLFSAQSPALSSSFDSSTNFTNLQYKLDMEGTKVGEVIPKVSIPASHSDLFAVIKYNSGTSQNATNGAGFTFLCSWDFMTVDTYFSFPGDGVNIASRCMHFTYTYSNTSSTTKRYGIFCPIEQELTQDGNLKLQVYNMKMPNDKGTVISDWLNFGYSTYLGKLATIVTSQSSGTIPVIEDGGTITYYDNSNQLVGINSTSNRLNWTFEITNYIQFNFFVGYLFFIRNNGYVRVIFENGIYFNVGTKCKIIQNFPVVNPTKVSNYYYCDCQYNNQEIKSTCTVTTVSNYIQFTFTNCYGCPYPAGIYSILHEENRGDGSIHSDEKYKIQTFTAASQFLDGVKDYTGEIYPNTSLRFDNDPMAEPNALKIEDVIYSVWQTNVLGNVQIKFSVNQRNLWSGEQIQVNLGDSVYALDFDEIDCYVKYSSNNSVMHEFASIDTSLLSKLILTLKNDIILTDTEDQSAQYLSLTLQCQKIALKNDTNFSYPQMSLKTSSGYEIYKTKEIDKFLVKFDDPPTSYIWSGVSISRDYNIVGQKTHLTINISILPQTFKKDSTTLSILLPNYYSTALTSMNQIYCSINQTNSSCILYENHTIYFPSLPEMELGYFMIINITGLEIPYYKAGKTLTFMFEMNKNSSNYEYYFQIIDKNSESASSISSIIVYNLTVSNNQIRTQNQQINYNFTVFLTKDVIQQGNILVIQPPSEFDNIFIRQLPPICQILNYSETNSSLQNIATKVTQDDNSETRCQVINNQLRIKINANETRNKTYSNNKYRYQIVMQEMSNPDRLYCEQDFWKFSIISSNNSALVLATNYFYIDNLDPAYPFITDNPFNDTIKSLVWSNDFEKFSGNQKSNATKVYKNFYYSYLSLTLSDNIKSQTKAFQYPFAIQLVESQKDKFNLSPSKLIGYPGEYELKFQINAKDSLAFGSYLLQFEIIADPYQVYTDLSLLSINVVDSKFDFGVISETFNYYLVYSTGFTYPIKLGFISEENSTSGLIIPDFSFQLQLTVNQPTEDYKNYFYLSQGNLTQFNQTRLQNCMLVGSSYSNGSVTPGIQDIEINLTFTDEKDYNKMYIVNKQLKFYYYYQALSVPTLAMEVPSISSLATSMSFTLSISTIGVLYYTVALSTDSQMTVTNIKNNCLSLTPFTQNNQRQFHYSIIQEGQLESEYNITISNLLSNKTYTLQIFAENLQERTSVSQIQKFTTSWNGGSINILTLTFHEILEKESQIAEILCSLVVILQLPIQKIQTSSGRYCYEFEQLADEDVIVTSRLLEEINENQTSSANTTNSTNTTNTTAEQSINIFSTKYSLSLDDNAQSINIYFLPDESAETDKVSIAITKALQDKSVFYYSLLQRIQSATLVGISELSTVKECQPIFNPRQVVEIVAQTSYISVQGFDLTSSCNSLIYVGLQINPDQRNSNTLNQTNSSVTNSSKTKIVVETTTPTFFELQKGQRQSDKQKTIAVQRKLFTYGKETPTFNFTVGIQENTNYIIYYSASSENPQTLTYYISVESSYFTTGSKDATYAGNLLLSIFNAIIILILVI